jgi:hypothetical protein
MRVRMVMLMRPPRSRWMGWRRMTIPGERREAVKLRISHRLERAVYLERQ